MKDIESNINILPNDQCSKIAKNYNYEYIDPIN